MQFSMDSKCTYMQDHDREFILAIKWTKKFCSAMWIHVWLGWELAGKEEVPRGIPHHFPSLPLIFQSRRSTLASLAWGIPLAVKSAALWLLPPLFEGGRYLVDNWWGPRMLRYEGVSHAPASSLAIGYLVTFSALPFSKDAVAIGASFFKLSRLWFWIY